VGPAKVPDGTEIHHSGTLRESPRRISPPACKGRCPAPEAQRENTFDSTTWPDIMLVAKAAEAKSVPPIMTTSSAALFPNARTKLF